MNNRLIAFILLAIAVAVSACTSSATSTGVSSNSSYDSSYKQPTNTQAGSYGAKPDLKNKTDAPVTIMQVGLDTGDVYPGEDYYVHAVVDNPTTSKKIEYVWTATSGEIKEVPESKRGDLHTLVEKKYSEAKAAAPATQTGTPGAGAPLAAGAPGSTPAGSTAAGTPTGAPQTQSVPSGALGTAGTQSSILTQQGTAGNNSATQSTATVPQPTIDQINAATVTQEEWKALTDKQKAGTQLTTDEQAKLFRGDQLYGPGASGSKPAGTHGASSAKLSKGLTRSSYTRWAVAGPEDDSYFPAKQKDLKSASQADPNAASASDSSAASAAESAAAATAGSAESAAPAAAQPSAETPQELRNNARPTQTADQQREEPTGAADNVVEGTASGVRDRYAADNARARNWTDTSTARAGRSLAEVDSARAEGGSAAASAKGADLSGAATPATPGKAEKGDTAKLPSADDSYKRVTLVTDEPFIMWTPDKDGDAKIYVKARYKTKDLSEVTELPVSVRLKEPKVTIADDNFPDVVREDEPLYVRIDADNLPAFSKGLFTLSYDPDQLSFRQAELGEFFDDDKDAKLFYMQPDKLAGKVLFAIDSNQELSKLSGGGPALYVKFKAKRDITSRDQTKLALVQDTASQYVLNDVGDNILPAAAPHPLFETALKMPPTLADTDITRTQTPGQPLPNAAAPGTAGGTSPAAGTPAAGGTPANGGAPATYNPPQNQTGQPQQNQNTQQQNQQVTQQPSSGNGPTGLTVH